MGEKTPVRGNVGDTVRGNMVRVRVLKLSLTLCLWRLTLGD